MVISGVNTVTYNGDGIATAWPYTFPVTDDTEIRVQVNNADGTAVLIDSDYYVDVVNSTVYYPGYAPGAEPPESEQPAKVQVGQTITVYRVIPITQEADLGEKWPFEVIEKGLDKLTMIAQQIDSGTKRTIDNALASMFQLAGVVTDTEKLQHITDQLNTMDSDAEIATNAAISAAGSATSATASAVSAADSASAAAKIVDVGVDPTLTVADAAAESRTVGDIVENPFVRKIHLTYMPSKNIRYSDTDYVNFPDGTYRTFASEMQTIPAGGVGFCINPKYSAGWGGRTFDIRFFVKNGDDYEPAESYNSAYSLSYYSDPDKRYRLSYYAPYASGVYYAIILSVPIASADTDPLDFIEVYARTKGQKTAERVPYLFPVAIGGRSNDRLTVVGYGMYGEGGSRHLYIGSFKQYGFIMPLKYIKRVSCNPDYCLTAQIYDAENGNLQFVSGIVAESYNLNTLGNNDIIAIGTGEIDLSQYNDGYVLIIIAKRPLLRGNTDNYTQYTEYPDLGGLAGNEAIAKNVFVELEQGYTIEHTGFGTSVFTGNVEVYENLMYDNTQNIEYGNSIYDSYSDTPWPIPARGSFSGNAYTGNMFWNVPIKHVTPKSMLTAAQNPNSRFCSRYISPNYTTVKAGQCAYGTHCIQTATTIHGVHETYWEDGAGFNSNWGNKFEMLPFDYKKDLYNLRVGDILFSKYGGSGLSVHMVVILDIVKIGNRILAISYLEGYPPFERHSAAINIDYFLDNIGDNIMSGIRSLNYLANYTDLRRIKPEYQLKLTDYREFPTSATVGDIMCDRGTDSVYGLDNDNVYLSVKGTVNTVYYDVTTNGVTTHHSFDVGDFTPTSRSTDELIEIDIKSIVTTPGYYEFYSVQYGDVQESFYVPQRESVSFSPNGDCSVSNMDSCYAIYLQSPGYYYTVPVESQTPRIKNGNVANYTGVPSGSTTTVYTPDFIDMFWFESFSVDGMPNIVMTARCYDKDRAYLGRYDVVGTLTMADVKGQYAGARFIRIVFEEANPDTIINNLHIVRPSTFNLVDWDSNGIFHLDGEGNMVMDHANKVPSMMYAAYDIPKYGSYWQSAEGVCASCDPSEAGN